MSINKAILIGNVGNNPEIRQTNEGKKIANLSLATSESWKDKNTGEKQTKTEWHRVVVFNENLSSLVEKYIKKGSKLYIEGKLQTRKWTDKQGVDRYSTEIVLQGFDSRIEFLDNKQSTSSDSKENESVERVDLEQLDNIEF